MMKQADMASRSDTAPHFHQLQMRHKRNYTAMKTCALAVLLGAALPAAAFQREGVLDLQTVEACLTVSDTLDTFENHLGAIGWRALDSQALGKDAKAGLAMIELTGRMGYGDAPDIRWREAWELAKGNSEAIKRLVVIPGAPNRKLYFDSAGGSVLKVAWAQGSWATQIECTMAASPADMAQTLHGIAASGNTYEQLSPVFTHVPGGGSDDDQAQRIFFLTLIDTVKLAGKIGPAPEISGVVQTHLRTKPPAQ